MKYSLVGVDGNIYCVFGYVRSAMKAENFSEEEINEVIDNAMATKSYYGALAVCNKAVIECNERAKLRSSEN